MEELLMKQRLIFCAMLLLLTPACTNVSGPIANTPAPATQLAPLTPAQGAACGDGVCDGPESPELCPADCADTAPPPEESVPPTSEAAPTTGAQQFWAVGLAVANVNEQIIDGLPVSSASRLLLSWQTPTQQVDHYEVTSVEAGTANSAAVSVSGDAVSLEVEALKSSATYEFNLQACLNPDCSQRVTAENTAVGTTAEEFWQLQGEGHSYETAIKVVEDGNNMPYVIVWGPEAGPELNGKAQLYYHPFPTSDWSNGIRTAVTTAPVSDLASLSHFLPTESGLQQPCDVYLNPDSCPPSAPFLSTFQAVPMAGQNIVRLYFETQIVDDLNNRNRFPTRYYSLDSQDGFQGQDFNPRSDSSICGGSSADYNPGGDCEPTLVIGVEGDADGGDSGLLQARQSKIGYPKRDSWVWDGAPGAFMIITGADACGQTRNGLFYAGWDGERWQVTKDGNGCAAPLVLNAHGPVVEHLGDGRYKLYYEDATVPNQDKPLRMVYADAALTGDSGIVDFDDWENAAAQAREVNFLWPDGSLLDEADESGLGDHMILVPTNDLAFQVMYVNLGGMDNSKQRGAAQGIGIAVLLNP